MRPLPSSLVLLALWTPRPRGTASFASRPPHQRGVDITCTRQSVHRHHALSPAQTTAEFLGNEIGEELLEQQHAFKVCLNDNDEILASLFGSQETLDDFFARTFGRRAVHFPRSQQPLAPPLSDIDLPNLYQTNEWTSRRKRGSQDMLDKSQTSYEELTEYIAEGGSIVVPVTPEDYLFDTKVQIERALGLPEGDGTSMNIYHSGPSAVALNIHYDAYPVFVLQLEGQKMWMIQDNEFGRPERDVTEWRNITMAEGDVLYLPQGVLHAATTAEGYETTTHATIGIV